MTARDARWLTLGALAYPLGTALARFLARKSVIYPY